MRRFWPYALTFVALAAIAAGFFYRSGREPRITDFFDVPKLGEEALPELLQRLRDFHRVVTRKGEKILEISASEASYFRDSNAVEIKAPSLVSSIKASGWARSRRIAARSSSRTPSSGRPISRAASGWC